MVCTPITHSKDRLASHAEVEAVAYGVISILRDFFLREQC